MLEEDEVIWVRNQFTGAWEPLESFTPTEMELLSASSEEVGR